MSTMRDDSSETSVPPTPTVGSQPRKSEHISDSCHVCTVHNVMDNTLVNKVHKLKTEEFELSYFSVDLRQNERTSPVPYVDLSWKITAISKLRVTTQLSLAYITSSNCT